MGVVSSGLSLGVGALYVRKYFDEEAKKNVVDMVAGIRKEFRKIIEKVGDCKIVKLKNCIKKK